MAVSLRSFAESHAPIVVSWTRCFDATSRSLPWEDLQYFFGELNGSTPEWSVWEWDGMADALDNEGFVIQTLKAGPDRRLGSND
jgi:hypothetical protein